MRDIFFFAFRLSFRHDAISSYFLWHITAIYAADAADAAMMLISR